MTDFLLSIPLGGAAAFESRESSRPSPGAATLTAFSGVGRPCSGLSIPRARFCLKEVFREIKLDKTCQILTKKQKQEFYLRGSKVNYGWKGEGHGKMKWMKKTVCDKDLGKSESNQGIGLDLKKMGWRPKKVNITFT